MKIEDRVTETEQDIAAIQQSMTHCREMHSERLGTQHNEITRIEQRLNSHSKEIDKVNHKCDDNAHSLNLMGKEVTDLINMKNSLNTKLWTILIALFISFVSFIGSLVYKNVIVPPQNNNVDQSLIRLEKMMEELQKTSKEKKSETPVNSKP